MCDDPFALAQYLRFAIHLQTSGNHRTATIEMHGSLFYSLQMYWFSIAHERAMRTDDSSEAFRVEWLEITLPI